jgi:hypothetical protein
MHIHPNSMSMSSARVYSAAGAEKAAAAQRADEVRKKLLKSAANLKGISDPGESFLVGQWMGLQSNPPQDRNPNQYLGGATGKVSDFA